MKQIVVTLAITVLLPCVVLAQEEGGGEPQGGTQSSDTTQGVQASDVSENADVDPNSIYINVGESVEVRRGTDTVENINKEDSETVMVHGVTGDVTFGAGSVTYKPSGRPELACPAISGGLYGPCKVAEVS